MKKSKRWISFLTLGLVFVAAFILIYLNMVRRRDQTEISYRMIYIPKIQDSTNDFWTSLIEGTQMASEEYRVDLKVLAPDSEDDYEQQKEMILEAIEAKPDVILLSPSHYSEITETARKVKEAGIKLVLVDSFLDKSFEDAAIATNNFHAGIKMGSYAKETLIGDEELVIGIVSHVKGSSTAMEREKGVRARLGTSQDRVVETVYSNSNYKAAYKVTVELMEKYQDINLIFGLNEYSAVGAARAIKDLGLTEQVRMVGFDSSVEEIQLLEEGVFSGIVVQKPFVMGYLGVEKAVQLMRGETILEEVDSGSKIITKENMYTEENQKLLFPFWDK